MWQEEVKAKEELDRLQREKYGSKDRYSHPKATAESADGWHTSKTAKLLNEPERTTQTDIQLAQILCLHL